jgi:hypothetical protein
MNRPGAAIAAAYAAPDGSGNTNAVESAASRALLAAAEHISAEASQYGISVTHRIAEGGWIQDVIGDMGMA